MILLDTNVIIKLIHNQLDLAKLKQSIDKAAIFGISAISIYELYFGLYQLKYNKKISLNREKWDTEMKSIRSVEDNFTIVQFNGQSADLSAEIYNKLRFEGSTVEIFDCMIAGSMKANGISKIITANVKHFERFPDVKIIGV